MQLAEVRRTFLNYFHERGHEVVASSPVLPHGDRTLLFTNAGMVQFKDYFTGREKPRCPRAATVQKCIRAGGKHNDLDNVGYTTRHLTFFEMLGNFSFGDYFKPDAIRWAWDLVTAGLGIDPSRLWVTVYREDEESPRLWREISGLAEDRIVALGEKDNFWSMGEVGPCGPCSEILVDRGEAFGKADVENGERFFEIWNLVFMQFEQALDGTRGPLPHPSIDTGMGLERIAMVLQGVDSVFEIDLFRRLFREIENRCGVPYDDGPAGAPHRVVADHLRSLVFALADGAEISNEGRGYVLRRILRRAARYGRKIQPEGTLLHRLVEPLVREMGDAYPELVRHRDLITRQIRSEEDRFGETLDRGIDRFEQLSDELRASGRRVVPGAEIFKLYDTFGFPADLVERMAAEADLEVDLEGFEKCMEKQKDRSRGASAFSAAESLSGGGRGRLDRLPQTEFTGYREDRAEAELQAAIPVGEGFHVVLSHTPFYAESGGQVGDRGTIEVGECRLDVEDTQRTGGRTIHVCRLREGPPEGLKSGRVARAAIDAERRRAIERNHSATHLLHAALREVLGSHVHQKGSLVEPERLRFDVTHFEAIGAEEIEAASEIVRRRIIEDLEVQTREMGREEAVEAGALAFFGEKYGDRVRVVRMGECSMELCGGTHVRRTGEIGTFLLAHEGSVSSGVRRVEALTAMAAEGRHREREALLRRVAGVLKTRPDTLLDRVEKLLEENRRLRERLEQRAAASGADSLRRSRVGDILFVGGVFDGLGGKELRSVYDGFKQESSRLISALVGRSGERAQVLVTVAPELVREGWSAKSVFDAGSEILGARGGGRPEMVQAGATRPEGAEPALKAMERRVEAGP